MSTWTKEDVERVNARRQTAVTQRLAKPSKYHNQKITIGDQRFDSKKEAQLWAELQLRQKAGEIHDLQRQVSFPLNCPVCFGSLSVNSCVQVAEYIADFVWLDRDDVRHVADCKGGKATMTKDFRLKAKWLALQEGIEIRIL